MARRKKSSAEGSLDSLLDTMTNVVGILVILLVVTQLGVKEAISRIGESEEVQPEAIAKAEADASRAWLERVQLERKVDDLQSTDPEATRRELESQLAAERKRLEELAAKRKSQEDAIVSKLEEAERKLKAEEARKLAELERRQRELEDQLASLRAKLAETPEVQPKDAKVVHLPNPRPAPEGAKPVDFICRENRIMQLNVEGAQARGTKWTAAYVARYRLDRDPKKGIDCDRLFRAFNREDFDDRYFTLRLVARNDLPYIVFQRKSNAGETIEQIERTSSRFQESIGRINPQQYYLRFLVWNDSFEVYLTARSIASEYRIPAGWQPVPGESEYSVRMRGKLRCGPPPPPVVPPPKPKTPPKPADPPRELPSDTID